MHDTLSLLRELNAQEFTSGAQIAHNLGISRASVSLGLAKAEDYGIHVERRHGVGYRLSRPIEWLSSTLIQGYLPVDSISNITISNTLASTNRQLLLNPQHGQLLAAEWQDNGRGRLGRTWFGAVGGSLLFSYAWRFENGSAQLAGLPLAVGVAIATALQAAGVAKIALKWPNDLLLPDTAGAWGKVGGILIEMQGDALGPSHVVIGIGLNLDQPTAWQGELNQTTASLNHGGLTCGRNQLLAHIVMQLEMTLTQFAVTGFAPLREQWEALHAWSNDTLNVIAASGHIQTGQFAGLAADGSLKLATAAGEVLVHSGDVSLRRVA
ncbi:MULTISPECIES: biotin--[acetyl-CoA-carboxylase] ligase [Deefgea]|uniref:biotin--[biotin carboxyl-carrier protein] ligase n=1 Tax=Deefgea chitinilytica TaxID=570276 RepID=A0ABS2CBG3_9NEIS|nr:MULTISPECIES: biotin--[acetyl-CoA-carboxylase] ligase [Deefgea]MBM5571481.1 biotin--[acetyl-CoA-carboxylase] ligase [Deefgea chitinilytica]MBM9888714.1 biotin--[acetyl-CoA-carboxylase] ligase [Deefgea sp. CFH1-16]